MTEREDSICNREENRMIRFPIDCPMECPHLLAWDMSVDDWTYVCNKLNVQIDGCDTWANWLLPTCPIERGEQGG